jgi:Rrf2 family protein
MLSTTAEYALRAMVFIASNPSVPTRREIAAATQIPEAYLVKVLRLLERAELIRTKRGPGGGYSLFSDVNTITVFDVISAISELPRIEKCPLGLTDHVRLCRLHARLDEVARLAEEAYRQTPLSDLLPIRGTSKHCEFPKT